MGRICLVYDIISQEESVLSADGVELVWEKVSVVGKRGLYIDSLHRPPNSDIEYLEKLNESLNRISNTNSTIWLEGDFNLPHINWETD